MARFGLLDSAIDTRNGPAASRFGAATTLETRVEQAVRWSDAAIEKVDKATLERWLKEEPRLHMQAWHLHQALAYSEHALPPGSEIAYTELERAALMPSATYEALMGADLGWPSIIDDKGANVLVNPGTYYPLRRHPDRGVRDRANQAYLGRLRQLSDPLGVLLSRRIEMDLALSKQRVFNNGIDAFLFGEGFPSGTYRAAIDAARSQHALLARYARIFSRSSQAGPVEFGDLYALPPFVRKYPIASELKHFIEANRPLGATYVQKLTDRLRKPWIDISTHEHKDESRNGVYWQVGGGHPYTLQTYHEDYPSARSFASAAALMMFYADIPESKTPERREEDFPVYGNAIWFMGEMLYADYLLNHLTDRTARIEVLTAELQRLWSVFFSNAVATQFEDELAARIQRGEALAASEIDAQYQKVLRQYYPEEDRTVVVDANFGSQWTTLGTVYYGHVHTEWMLAIAGGALMTQMVEDKNKSAIDAITMPMSRPNSFTSADLLRDAGADLTGGAGYGAISRRMARYLDLLEKEQ
jgi:oligoendopeptidase F